MAYFTAVLSQVDGRQDWRSVDVDLEAGSPDELGDLLRSAVDDVDTPVIAVLEREDEWFALVRTDAGVDVRVFVSDAVAAADSSFAELFAELPPPNGVLPRPPASADATEPEDDGDGDDGEPATEPAVSPEPVVAPTLWAGDADLLADLGCSAETLVQLAAAGDDPSAATVRIGELTGFADALEALR